MKTALLVGATGDVGQGIAAALLADGYRILAVARSGERLASLAERLGPPERLVPLAGSISTESEAAATHASVQAVSTRVDAIVISVSGPKIQLSAVDASLDESEKVFRENLWPQMIAVRHLLPLLAEGGTYLAIGGGLADAVVPGRAHMSMCQAAQRAFFKAVAAETAGSSLHVRELMIYAIVAGESNRQTAKAAWITDLEIGTHVSAILGSPDKFKGPVLSLKSKGQVGKHDEA